MFELQKSDLLEKQQIFYQQVEVELEVVMLLRPLYLEEVELEVLQSAADILLTTELIIQLSVVEVNIQVTLPLTEEGVLLVFELLSLMVEDLVLELLFVVVTVPA